MVVGRLAQERLGLVASLHALIGCNGVGAGSGIGAGTDSGVGGLLAAGLKASVFDPVRDKPRRSGRGRIARTP